MNLRTMLRRSGAPILGAMLLVGVVPAAPRASETHKAVMSRPSPHLVQTVDRLRDIGFPDEFLDQILTARDDFTFRGRFTFVEPAGDLDGNGGKDVFVGDVEYEITFVDGVLGLTSEISDEGSTDLSAISGTNGRVLWHRTYKQIVYPIPARVGKKAGDGAYILKGAMSLMGPFEQRYLIIDALNGNGKREWRRTYESIQDESEAAYIAKDAPLSFDTFDGVRGPAVDLLIGLGDVVATPGGFIVTTRSVVVDGKDGTEIVHPARDVGVNWIPSPWPAGDLDRDELADYVVPAERGVDLGEDQQPPSIGGVLHARRGDEGAQIWSRGGYEFTDVAWIFRLGNALGNGMKDLAIMTNSPNASLFSWESYLVDAGTGRARWRKKGGWPRSPGDISGDGLDDVVTRAVDVGFGKGKVTYRQWAYQALGKTLWKRKLEATYEPGVCTAGCSAGAGSGWQHVGDADRDGIEDHAVYHWVDQQPGEDRTFGFLISGRTGRPISEGAEEFRALGASIDGRGTDRADLELQGPNADLIARRGDTEQPLWRSSMTLSTVFTPQSWPQVGGLRLNSDGCADVVVSFASDEGSLVVAFDGGSGRMRWAHPIRGNVRILSTETQYDRNPTC